VAKINDMTIASKSIPTLLIMLMLYVGGFAQEPTA
jgi:hypothetical protein